MRLLLACFFAFFGLASAQSVRLQAVVQNLDRPLFLTYAPADAARMFILEQGGKVRIFQNGRLLAEPFLDLSSRISSGGERGLLGLAFHPEYRQNGFFYVNYTNPQGDTVVARYKVSPDPNRADAGSAQVLLTVDQPYSNHNGGMLAFGPDKMLYIGLGDGGSGGDPQNFAQNLNSLLGKILRIDVNGGGNGRNYGIPRDNPFVNRQGARPEIWSYGWRNPWRFSFDRETGDLWAGDVGQNAWEEVHLQAAGKGGGNYGWRVLEGSRCFNPRNNCDREGLILPVLEYDHGQGQSITGGYRYRGKALQNFQGAYFYADFSTGRVWSATEQNGKWTPRELMRENMNFSSFGEDPEGELYLIDFGGLIYKLVPR